MRLISCSITLLIVCAGIVCTAQQQRRNNNWIMSGDPSIKFSFNSNFQIDTLENNGLASPPYCAALTSASISDTMGQFQFFSSGFIVYNRDGYAMENGINVNCPLGNLLSNTIGFASSDQSSIILPKKNNQYYVFSTGMSDSLTQYWIDSMAFPGYDVFNYSIVDMDSNAGMGKVTVKNQILLQNQHYATAALTAVRHANNKDWWLVKADCYGHQYQQWLVKEDTILGPYYHAIADTANFCAPYVQIVFSEDGTKFASSIYSTVNGNDYTQINIVDMYDFNRGTGDFTFRNNYQVPCDTTSYQWDDAKAGISFSPDSKLLYLSTWYNIFQFEVADTARYSYIWIHGPDTTLDVFPSYHILANGEDGNLYIGNFDGSQHYMSYIDKPNIRGTGCDFVAHGIWQPYTNLMNPPNMPNYGLGQYGTYPLPVVSVVKVGGSVMVYPNPTSNQITIEYAHDTDELATFVLYDITGKVILEQTLPTHSKRYTIDLHEYAQGVYSYKITTRANAIFNGKLIKE